MNRRGFLSRSSLFAAASLSGLWILREATHESDRSALLSLPAVTLGALAEEL